jgi:hypothetical protein
MAPQLSFAGFAWKNLWRRRPRTLLTHAGIARGIGAFDLIAGAYPASLSPVEALRYE